MNIEALRKSRTSTKASLTRIETWFLQNTSSDIVQFEIRLERLKILFRDYEQIQDNIEFLATAEDPDSEDRSIIESRYFDLVSGYIRCIKQLTVLSPDENSVQRNSNQVSEPVSRSQSISVKLPDIKIQVFSGDVTEFESFLQLFDALIIKNPQLSDIQKFIYLKSYLKGEPLQLIDSLKITNENFDIALKTLKCRYENKIIIVNSYLAALLDIPNINKCKSGSLRELATTIQKNIQSLKNLNFSFEELWNVLLIFIFQKKLDYNTRKAFESERDHAEIPSLDTFLKFIEKRCIILESIDSSSPKTQRKFTSTNHITTNKNENNLNYPAHSNNKNDRANTSLTCSFCDKVGHRLYTCYSFKNLSYSDKMKFIKLNKLCQNCLGKHSLDNCSSTKKCSFCARSHNSLLHVNEENNSQHSQTQNSRPDISNKNNSHKFVPQNKNDSIAHSSPKNEFAVLSNCPEKIGNPSTSSHSALSVKSSVVLLATAKVTLYSSQCQPVQAKVLLDTGTQTSLITQKLANKLQCHTYNMALNISGISECTTVSNKMADIVIHSNFNLNKKFKVSCALLPNLTCKLPQYQLLINQLDIPKDVILADNEFFKPSEIDIIIGLDCYYDIILSGIVKLGNKLPVLQESHLGWVIAGVVPKQYTVSNYSHSKFDSHNEIENDGENMSYSFLSTSKVEKFLKKFWDIEETPEKPSQKLILSEDEQLAEKIFTTTTKILENGRFQVNLPFKFPLEPSKLGDSFTIAKKRFLNLENKFLKNPDLFIEYKKFIQEYVELGHAQYVPLTLQNYKFENKYFIPHLCVIREASVSTKLRVVYDASCPSSSGFSLNDICLKGYQVQPDLFDILCRFRFYPCVFTTDIKKMYRQILINPEHTFLQNILWRENQTDQLECIQLNTVTYGTNSAPFLATRILNEIASSNKIDFPLASEAISSQFYMDDGLCGAKNLDSLLQLHSELTSLLNRHGFELHKYCSNEQTFLEKICEKPSDVSYEINPDNVPNKVLGLKWNPTPDVLSISVPENLEISPVTKRKILSIVAQCYDPLGLINPVIVKGKLLVQKLWVLKMDWDVIVTDTDILVEFSNFLKNLSSLVELKIPRFYFLNKNILKVEIHGFSDASLSAYGCCIYFRIIYKDGTVSATLITSKSRVAPVKSITLPKLELCAMLLLSKLVKKVLFVFETKINFHSVNLWADSQVSLYWCQSHASRWSVFVAHRVSQIQSLTENHTWRYVRSADNSADLVSRGLLGKEILKNDLWWHGPNFLLDPDLDLSLKDQPILDVPEKIPEERKSHIVTNLMKDDFWEVLFSKTSTLCRLQRTLAFMFRFIKNIKTKKDERNFGRLSPDELKYSLNFIVRQTQNKYFEKEISEISQKKTLSNKQLLPLYPFLDDSGFLRVGGRLENANVPYQQKHPFLLPAKTHVTNLILNHEHKRLGHAGAQTTLSNVRLRFWPLDSLRAIKKIIRNCITCFRFHKHASDQIMANLPKDRVTVSKPFHKVGIDFGGPFSIKSSRLRKSPPIKAYIAIFVCMVTKAVHIEVVTGLSTDLFLLTLKRFISRRGNPKIIFTDNATNFSGARNELREVYNFFRNTNNVHLIEDFLSQSETSWKFIPPRSPHWGGIWEASVKSAKYHMKRLIGTSNFTFEEFSTIMCQIEAILNSRPLSPLSSDASDLNCLTPGHFLIGSALTAYPERDVTLLSENRLDVFQKISHIQQSFWKRWSVEYLNRLQNRPKWFHEKENIKENDMIILKEDGVPPLYWPLGRIIEAIQGPDGKVRVAKIRTAKGEFTRPITKLCVLPIHPFSQNK